MKKGSRPQAASFDVRDILERGVEPLDAVDLDGEVRSGLEVGLVEGTVEHGFLGVGGEVAVGIQSEGGGQGLALHGEGGGVEDLDGAVSQTGLDLGELLSGAGGGDLFVELGQDDVAVIIAVAVILIEFLAVGNALDGIDEVVRPVDAAADDGGIGSNAGHVVIVAGVERALGLRHGGGGGVVGVLGDELAAEVAQSGGGVGLFGGVRPGADELDLHGHARADGAGAQEVGGHTGDDFGEGVRADVADDGLFGLDGAFVDELLELHTGSDAGEVTAFMPDNTVVYLNSESSLRYPSRFVGESREVELIGEAYFDVTKDEERRFVVSTAHQSQIEVYGTGFNVEAYAADGRISTTLVEGSVGFFFKDKAGEAKMIKLKPYHKLVYTPESGETKMFATSCESEIAWKDGKIVFKNTSMEDILHMLGKRYNVDFVVKSNRIKEYSFTGTFSTQRLERILEYFKISSKINWRYLDSDEISDKKQRIEIY